MEGLELRNTYEVIFDIGSSLSATKDDEARRQFMEILEANIIRGVREQYSFLRVQSLTRHEDLFRKLSSVLDERFDRLEVMHGTRSLKFGRPVGALQGVQREYSNAMADLLLASGPPTVDTRPYSNAFLPLLAPPKRNPF